MEQLELIQRQAAELRTHSDDLAERLSALQVQVAKATGLAVREQKKPKE
jgi:DNA-binding ferritin-like protein